MCVCVWLCSPLLFCLLLSSPLFLALLVCESSVCLASVPLSSLVACGLSVCSCWCCSALRPSRCVVLALFALFLFVLLSVLVPGARRLSVPWALCLSFCLSVVPSVVFPCLVSVVLHIASSIWIGIRTLCSGCAFCALDGTAKSGCHA